MLDSVMYFWLWHCLVPCSLPVKLTPNRQKTYLPHRHLLLPLKPAHLLSPCVLSARRKFGLEVCAELHRTAGRLSCARRKQGSRDVLVKINIRFEIYLLSSVCRVAGAMCHFLLLFVFEVE